ncbi:MAG: hypothetical protein ABR499_04950 [Gemmatimonadaceae bacterium]
MLVFKTMRSSAVVTLLALGLAACSEGLTAPTFDASEPLMATGGNSSGSGSGSGSSGSGSSGRGKDSGSRTFTIWPGAGVFEKFGDHTLYMPANVVCDPATSGYGVTFWDEPCARAKQPIQVTATWSIRNSRPVISFSPDLRFAPSSHERDWVSLSLRDTKGVDDNKYYTILWFDKQAGRWVDESQTDPTLKARLTHSGNLVTRRLKHFSDWALWVGLGGYNILSGMGGERMGVGDW